MLLKMLLELGLYVNCFFHYPIFSMLQCMFLYFYLLYKSSNLGRILLVIYHLSVVFDQSPSKGGWDDNTNPFKLFNLAIIPNMHFKYRELCRSVPIYKLLAMYFRNIQLIKTSNLKPDKNYLFLYHPHGIISMGANIALSTNGCDFSTHFPGIHRSAVTLNATFLVPFYREWLLMLGFISSSKSSIVKKLTTSNPVHKSVVLVPGGAAEALHAHPGIFRLYLKRRKGFIRVAMETGCSLVPCIGFGENDLYYTLYEKNLKTGSSDFMSSLFYVQEIMQKLFTFSLPIVTHIFPRRVNIAVVVGESIHFEKVEAIDEELVNMYHQKYLDSLRQLYDKHKDRFGHGDIPMEIC